MTKVSAPGIPAPDILPFEPASETLQDILRKRYISNVAKWLCGKHGERVLAEEGGSHWEAAMTILFLSEVREVLQAKDEEKALGPRRNLWV